MQVLFAEVSVVATRQRDSREMAGWQGGGGDCRRGQVGSIHEEEGQDGKGMAARMGLLEFISKLETLSLPSNTHMKFQSPTFILGGRGAR